MCLLRALCCFVPPFCHNGSGCSCQITLYAESRVMQNHVTLLVCRDENAIARSVMCGQAWLAKFVCRLMISPRNTSLLNALTWQECIDLKSLQHLMAEVEFLPIHRSEWFEFRLLMHRMSSKHSPVFLSDKWCLDPGTLLNLSDQKRCISPRIGGSWDRLCWKTRKSHHCLAWFLKVKCLFPLYMYWIGYTKYLCWLVGRRCTVLSCQSIILTAITDSQQPWVWLCDYYCQS